jgi:hypothetical protein
MHGELENKLDHSGNDSGMITPGLKVILMARVVMQLLSGDI